MDKKAYSVQMSYDVSDEEKRQGERALLGFNYSVRMLEKAHDYLNMIKTPFKDNPDMKPEDVIKTRSALRRFRDQAVDHFNNFKQASFKCINIMGFFSSDTQTVKLIKSFISSVDMLEVHVNKFVKLFADLQAKDFSKNIVQDIVLIQKKCLEIKELVEERVKKHIQDNIVAKSWVDGVSDELQLKIQKHKPLLLELNQKNQEELNKHRKL